MLVANGHHLIWRIFVYNITLGLHSIFFETDLHDQFCFVLFCFFVFLIMIACDGWYGTGVTVSESVKVIITSPNFPFNYDNDKKCIWRVSTSDAGLLIKATINEFDLQYNTGSGDCPFDSLTFSDGDSSGGDVIGKYCDTIYPEVIYSTENGMYIEFQSDSFNTYKGFKVTVSAVKAGTHKSN